ncbi:MAG: tRNA lysidine(34) synthetase TilS, partial [Oscillospiraceae bacterium]|nr:tRNA lysidine(34) synthetase TilS [Oscillospiraceae bacterium]
LSLNVLRVDLQKEARERKLGLEECGRLLRYDFFTSLNPSGKIALAHTLSDRAETLIFNLARGTALRGLSSIPYSRPQGGAAVIRPLLDITRTEVEDYCRANAIPYATDSTNSDIAYTRNRIRRKIIPQLKELNGAFEQSLLRTLDALSEDEDYLYGKAQNLFHSSILNKSDKPINYQFAAVTLTQAPPPIKKRALRIILTGLEIQVSAESIARLDSVLAGGRISVGGNVLAQCRRGVLSFGKEIRNRF